MKNAIHYEHKEEEEFSRKNISNIRRNNISIISTSEVLRIKDTINQDR